MDKLPAPQRDIISKVSANRLVLKQGQVGFTTKNLDIMKFKDILQAYAQVIIHGHDKAKAPAPTAIVHDPGVEKLSLQLESQRIQLQAQLESQRLQNDQFQKELAFLLRVLTADCTNAV
jgi:hypothetical protein